MKILKLILLILLIIPLSSCWDITELSDIQIISAIGIDKVEDKYEVSIQIVKKYEFKPSPRGESPYIVYSELGDTIPHAYDLISKKVPSELYVGHVQYIIISEDIGKEGIDKFLDVFVRNETYSMDSYVYLTRDYSPKDIISIIHEITIHNQNLIELKSMNALKNSGESIPISVGDIQEDAFLKGKDISLPLISLKGTNVEDGFLNENSMTSRSDVYTVLDGMALFAKNILVGYMLGNETKGLSYIYEDAFDQENVVEFKNGCNVTVSISEVKTNIKAEYKNEPKINLDVGVMGVIRDVGCYIDFNDTKNIDKIKELTSEVIIKNYRKSINKAQSVGSDVFGFGEKVRRVDSKKWKEIKDDWNEIFKTIHISITIKSEIRDVGVIIEYETEE